MSRLIRIENNNHVRLADYDVFGKEISKSLKRLARPLRGKCVIHINATGRGGGVAEILQSQILFERALGIKSHWYAIEAPGNFFKVTKEMHDLLQGRRGRLGQAEKDIYLRVGRELSNEFVRILKSLRPDIVVIHDPQPLSIIGAAESANIPVISRLHIDLLTPNPVALEFIRPYLLQAQHVILSSAQYAANMPWLKKNKIKIIYPAIDPLSEKNKPISPDIARRILEEFSINLTKPVISQVSRFDPWKDPLGVIKAYYIAKNKVPDLQLILSGFFLAKDDPEAIEIFEMVKKHAKGDPNIFLFSEPERVNNFSIDLFVSAVYAASTVVVQKSIREGFGLSMTEAMWKGKALVAGMTTGALAQITNNKNGVLISSAEEAACAIVSLLKDEKLRNRLGRAAHKSVRRKFLMPRFVTDNLKVYQSLVQR